MSSTKRLCISLPEPEVAHSSPTFHESPETTFERRENRLVLRKLEALKPHSTKNRHVNRALFNVGRWNEYIPFLPVNTESSGYKVVEYGNQAYVIHCMCEQADSYGCGERAYGFSNFRVYQPGDREDIKGAAIESDTDDDGEINWDEVPVLATAGSPHYDEEGRKEKSY